jgi:hypothetical protein
MSQNNTGTVHIHVFGLAAGGRLRLSLAKAEVKIYKVSPPASDPVDSDETGPDGSFVFDLPEAQYCATATFKGVTSDRSDPFHVCEGETRDVTVQLELDDYFVVWSSLKDIDLGSSLFEHFDLNYKKPFYLRIGWPSDWEGIKVAVAARGATVRRLPPSTMPASTKLRAKQAKAAVRALHETSDFSIIGRAGDEGAVIWVGAGDNIDPGGWSSPSDGNRTSVTQPPVSEVEGDLSVALKRTASRKTDDLALWAVIRRATDALSFDRYADFMNWVFCGEDSRFAGFQAPLKELGNVNSRRFLPFSDTDAYRNVKAATEAFLMANCGIVDKFEPKDAAYIADYVSIDVNSLNLNTLLDEYRVGLGRDLNVLPYLAVIRAKLADERIKETDLGSVNLASLPASRESCYGILRDRLKAPCLLELIWSYWQEEGMLVQTMNAVTRRFQNMRSPGVSDPLANLEIDPLRSLNNLLWGMIQDEQHRLSVVRRNYEYDHHYGLRLAGKAVDGTRPADSRSKFLEAFHTLLSIVGAFYKRDDDTTMVAESGGFPITYGIQWEGDSLRLRVLKDAHPEAFDLVAQVALYESMPFTVVP